ncbi:MAG TPA: 3-oxoacyl-ACP reductase FabG [Gemmatimonadales bacterium]|nr:3-oxoacyl-ACP reductase FabG [Gemmatimonadales bacterium]
MEIALAGRRALVTGGNSGIGEAIAVALGASGARVAVNYVVHPEAAEAVVARIRKAGGEALAVAADVADAGEVARMFGQVDQAWGGVDILVNNAGIDGGRALAWEADPAQWAKVLAVNLGGAFHCAREALRRMVPAKAGVIVNLTSVHERIAWTGYSAYTASKAGLSMLTENLAQEAAPAGVRVVAVAPGAIKTPINRSVWSDPNTLADLLDKIPLNRMGTPEEIARMVVVLASDVASYVTGTTVFVDGGMTDYPSFREGG